MSTWSQIKGLFVNTDGFLFYQMWSGSFLNYKLRKTFFDLLTTLQQCVLPHSYMSTLQIQSKSFSRGQTLTWWCHDAFLKPRQVYQSLQTLKQTPLWRISCDFSFDFTTFVPAGNEINHLSLGISPDDCTSLDSECIRLLYCKMVWKDYSSTH